MDKGITLSSSHELMFLVLIGGMISMMAMEMAAPRRTPGETSLFRWINNVSLTLISYYLSLWAGIFGSISIAAWVDHNDIGLLQRYDVGSVWSFLIALVAVEFVAYAVHRAFHRIPLLWRIHAVHHNDTDCDVTTTFRHHPLEGLLPLVLTIPLFILLGAPADTVLACQLLRVCVSLFAHSNLYIPEKLDRLLRKVVVTPDFHRNHHCSEQRYTDSNYGIALSWFDYLLGTASNRPFDEQKSMRIGLEYFRERKDSRLDQLLLIPFRLHWPGGSSAR